MFMLMNSKHFHSHQLPQIREKISNLTETQWQNLLNITYKNPSTALLISLSAGPMGIDRFFIGEVGSGVIKLLTCGGFGIWTIVDWFIIQGACKDQNMVNFQSIYLQ